MPKSWGGKTYDTDFYEIDTQGNRISDQKDLAASEGWTNENEPWRNTPGWHGQPLNAEQERGIQQTNPTGWAERQAWRAANPNQAYGPDGRTPQRGTQNLSGLPGQYTGTTQPIFDWSGWNGEGGPSGMPQRPGTPGMDGLPWERVGGPDADAEALRRQLGGNSSFGQTVQDSIQRDLGRPTVDPNDPVIAAQTAAFRRASQRGAERERASAAQRANANGTLGSGGFDARADQIVEDQGYRDADFESSLLASELSGARDRTARAQQLGAGLLSQERQLGLQDKLGTNDSLIRRNALMLQQQLGLGDLDLRRLGLNNQNQQFYDSLGQQLGLSEAQLNQQALLALLGGF
jgi:hypothetical protein